MSSKRSWRALSLLLPLLLLGAAASAAQAQAILNGRVTSEAGAPIELANVYITEMNVSVVTDEEGRYTITIPAERVRGQGVILRARRIGFVAREVPILINQGTQTHDFALRQDVNRLTEIVVTGVSAGTEQRKVPFAVTTLSADEMPVASSNALSALQAKVPGAHIVNPSGRPGQAPSIVIRGPKSLDASGRGQGPLVIVDGIIMEGGTQDLNPHDIESIEIVKGAAGSSVYGSRAGAGVIQITTKSGRNAVPGVRFNVRNETGFSDIQGRYPTATRHTLMMDETATRFCINVSGQPACSRVVDFQDEALRVNEQGGDFALTPYPFTNDFGISNTPPRSHLKGYFQTGLWPVTFNPVDAAVTPGLYNQTNVDMQGRFGNTGFFASVSHQLEEGAIIGIEGDRRSSARINLDQSIGDDWNVQLTSYFARRQSDNSGSGNDFFRLTRQPLGANIVARDRFGRYFVRSNPLNQGGQNYNPVAYIEQTDNESKSDRYLGSMIARYTPLDWLQLEGTASLDRQSGNGFALNDRGFRTTSSGTANLGSTSASSFSDLAYNLGFSALARHEFTPDLLASLNARYTFERQDSESISASGSNIAIPGLRDLDMATESFGIGSGSSSVRAIGASLGGNVEYLERYIFDAVYRYDGSSLFGENERWAPYYRGSFAWRIAEEPFWPWSDAIDELKLRASIGTAGGRPSFSAQYETVSIGAGGSVSGNTLGNKDLKPETTTETEFGFDAEIMGRYGISMTYARAITKDQIFEVPVPTATGFGSQWRNAGTLDGRAWEVALTLPFVNRGDFNWTSRLSWDQTRTYIDELGVPAFFQSTSSSTFRYATGERIGNIYGKKFVTSCSELPAPFNTQCGPGQEFQHNDQGFVVWVGEGRSWTQGVTDNLWQATKPGCIVGGVGRTSFTGEVACEAEGGTVNTPWGVPELHWGMLIVRRDSLASPQLVNIGNTLPDYRLSMSHNVRWRKFSAFFLVDRSVGNSLMNEEIHWSLGDFMVAEQDQIGQTVESAKPIGYYWRAPRPDHSSGVGGFYDVLGANNHTVQDGSYTKLRELSLSYDIGQIPGLQFGEWAVTLTGRNLYTWTDFVGWDPEVGVGGGNLGSSAINAVASYQYPPRRTFTFTVNTRF